MKKKIYYEEHKKLIDLVTYLPFGYQAEYFYTFMLLRLKDMTKSGADIFEMYPKKIHKQILLDFEHLEQVATERKKVQEAKEKPELSEKDKYLCSSVNMLCEIKREDVQRYLYLLIKDVYEEVCHE